MNFTDSKGDTKTLKKLKSLNLTYKSLFNKSFRYISKQYEYYINDSAAIARGIEKIVNSGRLDSLLEKGKEVALKEHKKDENAGLKADKLISNLVYHVVSIIDINLDIGSRYKLKNGNKSILSLNFNLAETLIDDPKNAIEAILLLNKAAINAYVINEIFTEHGIRFEHSNLLNDIAVELYETLIDAHANMSNGEFRAFLSECWKIIEDTNRKEFNSVALLRKTDIHSDIADDEIAANRLLILHERLINYNMLRKEK